jgi:hypothetical protein
MQCVMARKTAANLADHAAHEAQAGCPICARPVLVKISAFMAKLIAYSTLTGTEAE